MFDKFLIPKDPWTIIGLIGFLASAAYHYFVTKDMVAANALFLAALGLLGLGREQTKTQLAASIAANQAFFAATDTEKMRNDTAAPGPPLSPYESTIRASTTKPADVPNIVIQDKHSPTPPPTNNPFIPG